MAWNQVPDIGGGTIGAREENAYVGTYSTREEAEVGLEEKNRRISQLEARTRELEEMQRRRARLENDFMQQEEPVLATPVDPRKFAWEALPNPVDDPEGYSRKVREQTLKEVAAISYNSQVEAQNRQVLEKEARRRNEDLWNDFASHNPDLAPHRLLVAGVFDALTGGQIQGDLESTFQRVAQASRQEVAKIRGAQGMERGNSFFAADSGQTGGLPSGMFGSFETSANRQPQVNESLTEQMKQRQKKSRLY